MAQSGYTPIQLYYSTTASAVPLAANLNAGELAINTNDGKLYYKSSAGTVTLLAGAGGTGIVAGSNTQIQFNNSGVFGASSNLTWSGTVLSTTGLTATGAITLNTTTNNQSYTTTGAGTITISSGTAGSINNMNIGATTAGTGTFTSLSDSGNLTFTGTGNRITGDFSNATAASRVAIQTSTTNGNTIVPFIPNGSATQTNLILYNSSDVTTNFSLFTIRHNATASSFASSIGGTGTYVPITFETSGTEKLRIAADTTGTITIGGTAPRITGDFSNATVASRVAFQTSTTNGNTSLGVLPNGTAVTSNFRSFNNPDPTNASYVEISGNGSLDARISSGILGTGTYLPMTFYTGGSERMRLDTNGNLGVGFSTVPDLLAVYSASATRFSVYGDGQTQINAFRYSTDASAPQVGLAKSRGTYAAPTAVASGDQMASINFQAYGGTNRRTLSIISSFVDTYTSDTNISSYLLFGTSPSGSAASIERMRIDASGNVVIGNTVDNNTRVLNFNSASGGSSSIQSITVGATNQALTFSTTFSTLQERMRITGDGNVGIGTASPGANKVNITSNVAAQPQVLTLVQGYAGLATDLQWYNANNTTSNTLITKRTDGGLWIYQSGADYIAALTNNSERMRIDSSGNVGIGTSSPAQKLQVTGKAIVGSYANTGAYGLYLRSDAQNVHYNWQISTQNAVNGGFEIARSDAVGSSTFNSPSLVIDSSGNVGIGTNSPSYKLDVVGTGDLSNRVSTTGTSNAASIILQSGSGTTSGLFAYARFLNNDTNAQDWRIGTYGTNNLSIVNAKAGTVPVTVDTSGNVGIGTSSPAFPLDVGGTLANIRVAPSTATNNALTRYVNTGGTGYVGLDGSAGGLTAAYALNLYHTGAYPIVFSTSGAERMRIDSSGNLLVGTTSAIRSGKISVSFADASSRGIVTKTDVTTTSSAILFTNPNGDVGNITTNGTATAYNTSSDQRLKENIQDAESASALIDALQVRQFDWKIDNSHQRYGFVAQELVTVAPEAVHQPTDSEEMMAVDYSKLVPMLVKEIQSLRKRLADAGIA